MCGLRIVLSRSLAICLGAMLSATGAFAQGVRLPASMEIASVKELRLETGRPDPQAQRCGLAVSDLETPLLVAVEPSSLRCGRTSR